ncbi:MAG TPA: hypothetical protein PK760_11830, partial [Flavobacteriales bacterium]|nr:hypothetical protein [Flavobacteriales bacterium]
ALDESARSGEDNPSLVNDVINVSASFTGTIVSSTGSTVMSVRRATRIDVSTLSEGNYALRAADGRTFKFVKAN